MTDVSFLFFQELNKNRQEQTQEEALCKWLQFRYSGIRSQQCERLNFKHGDFHFCVVPAIVKHPEALLSSNNYPLG